MKVLFSATFIQHSTVQTIDINSSRPLLLPDLSIEPSLYQQRTDPRTEDVRLSREGDVSAAVLCRREDQRSSVESLTGPLQRQRAESPRRADDSNEHVIVLQRQRHVYINREKDSR